MTVPSVCGIITAQEKDSGGAQQMTQFVPLSKQSKKAQKVHHARKRGSWYDLSPVTRTCPSGKAYDRNKVKRDSRSALD